MSSGGRFGRWGAPAPLVLAGVLAGAVAWVSIAQEPSRSELDPTQSPPGQDTTAQDEPAPDEPAPTSESTDAEQLAERHQSFLQDVEPLISPTEREVFLSIPEDYQRDAFIRRFWKARDPFPQTVRNELQDQWSERVKLARESFGTLKSERARMMLYFGAPSRRTKVTCNLLRQPVDIWTYERGSDLVGGYFTLVFSVFGGQKSAGTLWHPRDGLHSLMSLTTSIRASEDQLARALRFECIRGDDLLAALAQTVDTERLLDRQDIFTPPNDEWVQTFKARSTAIPDDAELLEGCHLEMGFPGRHQSRTVVQNLITVPKDQLTVTQVGDYRGFNLLVDGEILRKGELFDQFRYRFDFPEADTGDQLPLVVQRYLRPGTYRYVVKVEDTNGHKFHRREMKLVVPRVNPTRQAIGVDEDGKLITADLDDLEDLEDLEDPVFDDGPHAASGFDAPTPLADRLAEANASISTGDHTIRILSLPEVLQVGRMRVEARTRGEGIARVAFLLNDRPVMRKSSPPYSVELNLGDKPTIHTLAAVALDADGNQLAIDEVLINSGPHRFGVRLIEPQRGKAYRNSVRAHVEVDVPEGERLDRVELFLNDTRVATLYQPPFEQPILLPDSSELSYIRAGAFLSNGDLAEDVQFINAPDYVDEMRVSFVELYTSVLDRKGNFVEGLTRENFNILEDGKAQKIRRFDTMRDLPIRAGLVIDTSLSMVTSLPDVEKAAYRFLEEVMEERDRAALVTFADEPQLKVRFTSDTSVLAGGLANLEAEGETALYDSIIFTLHYFSGLKGKRAVVVLTDGEDSSSRYTFEDAIEFARHTGVAVYIIGLNLPSAREIRLKLRRITNETGGELFFIDSVRDLKKVYDAIQLELRSQYLIAYQSSSTAEGFREVEIELPGKKGLEAKSIRGYYP